MLDPSRLIILFALIGGAGAALLFSEVRWFSRISLTDRLLPFAGGTTITRRPQTSLRQLVIPRMITAGERLVGLFGIHDDLTTRLRRANSAMTPADFRMQQLGSCGIGLALALMATLAFHPPSLLIPFLLGGGPLLAFLLREQQLISAATERRQSLGAELPVVTEQLAMLLSAGYSLGAALNRLAERNSGVIGDDLQVVCTRVRQGLSIEQALNEWADIAAVAELTRLVAVLTVSNETSDLGRLVGGESKAIRREAQRQLAETIERRGQQVWVPVTVATLVPGVIFLIIPFLQALQIFSST